MDNRIVMGAFLSLAAVTSISVVARPDARHPETGPSEPIAVHEVFTRSIRVGCQYRATIHGRIAPVRVSGADPGTRLYRADLEIDADLDCPPLPRSHQHDQLSGGAMTRAALVREVESRSRIVVGTDGVECFYAPQFRFDGQRLAAGNVVRWCRTPSAHGGGPIAVESYTP